MSTWQAVVDFTTSRTVEDDQLFDIIETLSEYGASASALPDGTGVGIALKLEADTALDAATEAVRLVSSSGVFPDLTVVSIEATEWNLAMRRLDEPTFPPVVGYAEIARMSGVTRQRAARFPDCDGFPHPVIRTSQGPLYAQSAVESWLANRIAKAGRPKKA